MDWFERLTGFRESDYETTRARLSVVDGRLASTHRQRTWRIGSFETPTLAELRDRARGKPLAAGPIEVRNVVGDIGAMHRDPSNAGALFQVASQFNCLEMTGPSVTPEDGVTGYLHDPTQGPACAVAAGAATIYRNYLVPVAGQTGQRHDRQIDCLRDLGDALGNHDGRLWRMRNGYALCTPKGLQVIDARLARTTTEEREQLTGLLRIGLHWNVEVTDGEPGHSVSQAFCSALPVSYANIRSAAWRRFASLVLEGAYEATLLAALLNAGSSGTSTVYLTRLGGGAFGNSDDWIHGAIESSLGRLKDAALDVRIVNYGSVPAAYVELAERFGGCG